MNGKNDNNCSRITKSEGCILSASLNWTPVFLADPKDTMEKVSIFVVVKWVDMNLFTDFIWLNFTGYTRITASLYFLWNFEGKQLLLLSQLETYLGHRYVVKGNWWYQSTEHTVFESTLCPMARSSPLFFLHDEFCNPSVFHLQSTAMKVGNEYDCRTHMENWIAFVIYSFVFTVLSQVRVVTSAC
jgi:hypothetical protein